MDTKKIYLTEEGLVQLRHEYDDLAKVKRTEVLERLTQARSMGDLSENAEYTAARDELSFIDGRIEEIEDLLKQVSIIHDDAPKSGKKKIQLGSSVVLHHHNKEEAYTVVGEWEADPMEKKISHESPLGKALLGKGIGEAVEVEAPAGKILYKILNIK